MDTAGPPAAGSDEFLWFALTPPRATTAPDRVQAIADATAARLRPLGLDGLILYDIDDEAARNPTERPFPFTPTLDPARYLADNLHGWDTPVVVYRAVGKYPRDELGTWLAAQDPARVMTVLVGAAAGHVTTATSLPDAQKLARAVGPDLALGGVAIPERHSRRADEHLRLLTKQAGGCRFFVTQVVYDVNASKNLVSDYHYACAARGVEPVPIVFTFSVCGSLRTLEFLRWLGIDVPRWIENDLVHATDTLEASLQVALATATELMGYCRALGVPFGVNVESVSIRRVEIDAAVRLAQQLRALLRPRTNSDTAVMADDDELATLTELAARVAPTLVGRTREQAEAHLARTDARLSARFAAEGDMVTMEFRYGRITATVADGVVVRATPG